VWIGVAVATLGLILLLSLSGEDEATGSSAAQPPKGSPSQAELDTLGQGALERSTPSAAPAVSDLPTAPEPSADESAAGEDESGDESLSAAARRGSTAKPRSNRPRPAKPPPKPAPAATADDFDPYAKRH
jgi:hypothetical protein